ncbi:peptide deformylase [Mariniblastus sp.]|nr:peptide deformylase [Mariniblastus sp.]MDB4756788.1 peptide deformylase [Mariniblastus sp.]
MEIVHYPHPTLRYHSKPIRRVNNELKKIVDEMFDLMYEASGVGLAANQVDLPVQLFVTNPAGERGDGEEHVFINPVLSRPKGSEEKQEGCLSLPELYGNVIRPREIHCQAYNLKGQEFKRTVDGLFGRIIQHETDHLQGVLFIDRMKESIRESVSDEIEEFEIEFQSMRDSGTIPDDSIIRKRLADMESRFC